MTIARYAADFENEVATALAENIAERLRQVLDFKTRAVLALSGGRSPQRVLPVLARAPMDWSAVDVTLSDERWVPPSDPASNAALIDRCFLQEGAARVNFIPLWTPNTPHAEGPTHADARLRSITMPLDIIYLGIGEDGHLASLFPADTAAAFTASHGFSVSTLADVYQAPRERISLDLPTLLEAATIYLHFGGAAKAAVYETAVNMTTPSATLPLSLIVQSGHPDIRVFSFRG